MKQVSALIEFKIYDQVLHRLISQVQSQIQSPILTNPPNPVWSNVHAHIFTLLWLEMYNPIKQHIWNRSHFR